MNYEKFEIKANHLLWSYYRQILFEKCKRAYFIHYYLTINQKIINDYPSSIIREASFCRALLPFDIWLTKTLRETLREAVAKTVIGRRTINYYLQRLFEKKTLDLQQSLINREYLFDIKRPNIQEHYYRKEGYRDPDELTQKITYILSDIYSVLIKYDSLKEICNLNFIDLRTDDSMLKIDYPNFSVCFFIGLIYFYKNKLCSLDIRTKYTDWFSQKEFNNGISHDNALLSLYLKKNYPNLGIMATNLNFSEEMSSETINQMGENAKLDIEASVKQMMGYVNKNGNVNGKDFPPCSEQKICTKCQYFSVCNLLDH